MKHRPKNYEKYVNNRTRFITTYSKYKIHEIYLQWI